MNFKELFEGVEPKMPGAPAGIKIMTPQQFVAKAGDMPGEESEEVTEDDAGDIEQRVLAKVAKYKEHLAHLKKTDPEAYKREMAKRETERARMPAVSTFEGVAEGLEHLNRIRKLSG